MTDSSSVASTRIYERPRLLAVIGIVITLLAFGRITSNEFLEWDDATLISRNPKLNPPTLGSVLGYALPKNVDLYLYIPLTDFCWGALAALSYVSTPDATGSHLDPSVFHLASVALHLLNAAMVWVILRQMLEVVDPSRAGGRQRYWPAWVGAMVFAIHPLQVEAVAWASGLRDLLEGFFILLCVSSFLRFRIAQNSATPSSGRKALWWYASSTACLLLANLAKPGAVATPLGLLLIDRILLRTTLVKSLSTNWIQFVLMIPLIVLTRHVQPYGWKDLPPPALYLRPFVAGDALAFYTAKLFWPLHLTFDYTRRPAALLSHWYAYVDWIVPAGIVVAALLARTNRLLLAGLAFAIAEVLPVLGFVPFGAQDFSTVCDHYMYPSMLGVAMIVAWEIDRFSAAATTTLAWLLIAVFAILTFQTAGHFHDDDRFIRNAIALYPDSWNALNGLALNLDRRGDAAGAEAAYKRSVSLNPRVGVTHLDLALLYIRQDRAEESLHELNEMMRYYQLQSHTDDSLAKRAQIAIAMLMLKRHHPAQAIDACNAALAIDPAEPRALAILRTAKLAVKLALIPATSPDSTSSRSTQPN